MSATFASQEWVDALRTHLDDSADVRTQSVTWIFGPLVLVADADEESEFAASALRIDLHEGSVRGIQLVDVAQAARSPFALGGSLARWKAVFGGQLSLVDGILDSRLRVRGDLPTLVRHRPLLDAIAAAGAELETTWPEPAAAPA